MTLALVVQSLAIGLVGPVLLVWCVGLVERQYRG